jgi:hypothetical protein
MLKVAPQEICSELGMKSGRKVCCAKSILSCGAFLGGDLAMVEKYGSLRIAPFVPQGEKSSCGSGTSIDAPPPL